jgi:tetratricopeptide (TPR) repeat protein
LDKYEYKVRADEIKSLISQGEYADAVKIADSIDWRRVKSVMMLCTISDLYKINRRFEDSRDILLLAYDRHAGGRLIVYSLCELSIKLGEYVQALEYYKEFVQLAPKDSGRYILQYKLYEAQEVSLEERIEVLEELKKRDYRERWAYELAYLYHRVGLASKCVEECDEMFLWFGEGRHVLKGLELKMLHQPLSQEQQVKYDQMKQTGGFITSDYAADQQAIQEQAHEETEEEEDNEFSLEENILTHDTREMPGKEDLDIQVKTVDVSQYNTINLQKELAESMKEILEDNIPREEPAQEAEQLLQTQVYESASIRSSIRAEEKEQGPEVNQDTDEMQLITEEDLKESGEKKQTDAPVSRNKPEEGESEEVFFGNTEEVNIQEVVSELAQQNGSRTPFTPLEEDAPSAEEKDESVPEDSLNISDIPKATAASGIFSIPETSSVLSGQQIPEASPDPSLSNTGVIRTFNKPSGYDDMLSQEYDGQISLVVPEQEKLEKQITGQLSIEDIMAEWEKMKQENERRRMEEIRKRVHQQTDTLFADFDESTKSGLLEELEKAMVTAAIREEKLRAAQERPKVIKMADIDRTGQEKEPLEEAVKVSKTETPDKEAIPQTDPVAAESLQIPDTGVSEEELEALKEVFKPKGTKVRKKKEPVKKVVKEDNQKTDVKAEKEPQVKEGFVDEEAVVLEPSEEQKVKEEGDNKHTAREMTNSEREQFAPFIHHKRTRNQIVEAIDNISMASYTGNVIITGEEGTGTTALAKLLVKEIQLSDSNFSGKVAKISGSVMNKKDIGATLSKLSGGALIVEAASAMKKPAADQLLKELEQEGKGLIILLEDTKPKMNEFLVKNPDIKSVFNLRVDVEALDDQTLVKYARKYALEQEYTIDELGVLALHTRIADMQTSDHEVTLAEIEELVDEAIYYADRKTPKHFFDVLLGKRYDEEDMIVLRENDFMHY